MYLLLKKSYSFGKGDFFAEREEERVIIARMFEWALDSIDSKIAIDIIITILRARIAVLREKARKGSVIGDENLFEETLYQLYLKITAL